MTSRRFTVLCLDMAGTTVADDDSVMNAFAAVSRLNGTPGSGSARRAALSGAVIA